MTYVSRILCSKNSTIYATQGRIYTSFLCKKVGYIWRDIDILRGLCYTMYATSKKIPLRWNFPTNMSVVDKYSTFYSTQYMCTCELKYYL